MQLIPSQRQQLGQQQLHALQLLRMNTLELESYVQELAENNPMVELPERLPNQSGLFESVLVKSSGLEDNDGPNPTYPSAVAEETEPLALASTQGGLEDTLFLFLSWQIDRLNLDERLRQAVRYLAACLDEEGYLRVSPAAFAEEIGASVTLIEQALSILKGLEPAGVGASDLSDCLTLQLLRIGKTGTVLEIAQHHLELLAKHHYHVLAQKLGVSVEEVREAEETIRRLVPRPGALFFQPGQAQYILPDVWVEETECGFHAYTRREPNSFFSINKYYRLLLSKSEEPEVRAYLGSKLRQAESVLWAINQRMDTLRRCAQFIAERQSEFFKNGQAQTLTVLRMADAAQALGLHESTISRCVHEKYLQCRCGIYPMEYFFSRSAGNTAENVGAEAAQAVLLRLIRAEDKASPFSDQKLCALMAAEHYCVSRRTVAKYRAKLNIPDAARRKCR